MFLGINWGLGVQRSSIAAASTMKTLLSLILIAYTFVAAGALTCTKCANKKGDTCTDFTNQICDEGTTRCFSNLMRMRFGKKIDYRIWKGCVSHKKWCENTYNMSFGEKMDFHSIVYCCEGDNCNQGPLQMAPVDETPNGMECPSCFSKGESCKPQNVKCVGTQTQCYSLSGRIYQGDDKYQQMAMQGCGSSNVCQKSLPSYPDTLLEKGFTLDCAGKNH